MWNCFKKFFEKKKSWDDFEENTILGKIHYKFQQFIAHLIYDREWIWLELMICTLCDFEMGWHLLKDNEFRHYVDGADTIYPSLGQDKSYADLYIPKQTLYCEACPFADTSSIATFFYGQQSAGYCHYLGKGDYSFTKPTMILWDGCKECGKFEDFED